MDKYSNFRLILWIVFFVNECFERFITLPSGSSLYGTALDIVFRKLRIFLQIFERIWKRFSFVFFASLHLEWRPFASFLIPFGYCYWIIFSGDTFDGGAGKICFCTGRPCCGGVTWFFFKYATSFFYRFISSSKFCLGFCVFSSSTSDVAEAADLGLLWSSLFSLLNRSFWASYLLLLFSAIFCLLSFLRMLVLLCLRRMLA